MNRRPLHRLMRSDPFFALVALVSRINEYESVRTATPWYHVAFATILHLYRNCNLA
jgi:hypothetical protein